MPYVNSAQSPLKNPLHFIREGCSDAKKSLALSKRFFLQNIAQQYRYSSLGILWAFAPSVVIALAVSLGRGNSLFAPGEEGRAPLQVYVIVGVIIMQTFLESLNPQRILFTQYRNILARQRIPIESLALSQFAESLFHFVVKIPLVLLVLLIFGTPSLRMPFLPCSDF